MYESGHIDDDCFWKHFRDSLQILTVAFWPIEQTVDFLSNSSVALTTELFQAFPIHNIYIAPFVLD